MPVAPCFYSAISRCTTRAGFHFGNSTAILAATSDNSRVAFSASTIQRASKRNPRAQPLIGIVAADHRDARSLWREVMKQSGTHGATGGQAAYGPGLLAVE